jgi:hypothetical protein
MNALGLITLFALLQILAVGFMLTLTGVNRRDSDEEPGPQGPGAGTDAVASPRGARLGAVRGNGGR